MYFTKLEIVFSSFYFFIKWKWTIAYVNIKHIKNFFCPMSVFQECQKWHAHSILFSKFEKLKRKLNV